MVPGQGSARKRVAAGGHGLGEAVGEPAGQGAAALLRVRPGRIPIRRRRRAVRVPTAGQLGAIADERLACTGQR